MLRLSQKTLQFYELPLEVQFPAEFESAMVNT
jgi:hypothetical protein